jgi:hypothetical protein
MHFSLYSFTLFRCVVDYYVYVPSVHSSLLVLQITFIDPHYHLFFLEVWSRRSYPLMRQWWSYSSLNISRCCRYSAHVSCSLWHFCTRHWTCIHRTWLWRLLNRSNTTHHAASFFPSAFMYDGIVQFHKIIAFNLISCLFTFVWNGMTDPVTLWSSFTPPRSCTEQIILCPRLEAI